MAAAGVAVLALLRTRGSTLPSPPASDGLPGVSDPDTISRKPRDQPASVVVDPDTIWRTLPNLPGLVAVCWQYPAQEGMEPDSLYLLKPFLLDPLLADIGVPDYLPPFQVVTQMLLVVSSHTVP